MTEIDLTKRTVGGPPADSIHEFVPPPAGQGGEPVCSRCGVRMSVANQHIAAGSAVLCTEGKPQMAQPVLDVREKRARAKDERERAKKQGDYDPFE